MADVYVEGHPVPHYNRRGRFEVWLIKIVCPFCGKTHTHGGGDNPNSLKGMGGWRTPHCWARKYEDNYYIVLKDPDQVAAPFKKQKHTKKRARTEDSDD